jgi:phosphoribosyl 1,2-cyclic phosphodiesterase
MPARLRLPSAAIIIIDGRLVRQTIEKGFDFMQFCSLYSGSSGNCLYVAHGRTRLLVDAGLSGKKIEQGLVSADVLPTELDGILITHEHRDHIHGAGVLSRRYNLPIYANAATWEAMAPELGKIDGDNVRFFVTGVPFDIGDLQIDSFPISHDAAEPVGFAIDSGNHSLGIATDTGVMTDTILGSLKGRELVVLESNHDAAMLETGPYPYPLKRRIAGEHGHLSNDTAGDTAVALAESGVKQIVLAHLSHENNLPILAYQTSKGFFEASGISERDTRLAVARRHERSSIFDVC